MAATLSLFLTVFVIQSYLLGVAKGQSVWKSGHDCRPVCPGGTMCVVEQDGSESCVCPTDCPDTRAPVCTVYLMEFNSLCELHKFACAHQLFVAVKYEGSCKKNNKTHGNGAAMAFAGSDPLESLKQCPDTGKLMQFRTRYMTWLYLLRVNPKFGSNQGFVEIEDFVKQELAEWEFSRRDLDGDGRLSKREVQQMIEAVPLEACLPGFLLSADLDGQDGITIDEWNAAFNVGEESIGTKRL